VSTGETTLIYDGDCRLCQASVNWLRLKLDIAAVPFQSANLECFVLTPEECAKEVIVHTASATFRGAAAVAYLLRARGNRFASILITASGPLGRFGYHWVATHRNLRVIKLLTRLLERSIRSE
jgi:predicted DCC family thiol-disulfide oxidoreductase YuxK